MLRIAIFLAIAAVVGLAGLWLARLLRQFADRNSLANQLRRALPAFAAKVANETQSPAEVFGTLVALCTSCGCKSVEWVTVGLKPNDQRQHPIAPPEPSLRYGRATAPISTGSFINLTIGYQAAQARTTSEVTVCADMISDTVAAAFRRIISRGVWPLTYQANVLQRQGHQPAGHPGARAVPPPDRRNPAMDEAWTRFVELCRAQGFVGAGWKTIGVWPPDERSESFEPPEGEARGILNRSVPVSPESSVALHFVFEGAQSDKDQGDILEAAQAVSAAVSSLLMPKDPARTPKGRKGT